MNWTNANGNIDDGVTFSFICGSEGQDVWHVATTGSDGGAGTQESPFATIQMGINVAGDGNTVHVAAGTYVENIDFSCKGISVIGENQETTIIDGNQSGTVVLMQYGSGGACESGNSAIGGDALISGFTLQNGSGFITPNTHLAGGGMYITGGNNDGPTLSDLIIKNNNARHGGGIYFSNSEVTLNNIIVHGNTAIYAGA